MAELTGCKIMCPAIHSADHRSSWPTRMHTRRHTAHTPARTWTISGREPNPGMGIFSSTPSKPVDILSVLLRACA